MRDIILKYASIGYKVPFQKGLAWEVTAPAWTVSVEDGMSLWPEATSTHTLLPGCTYHLQAQHSCAQAQWMSFCQCKHYATGMLLDIDYLENL
jgi:hypothetical protein